MPLRLFGAVHWLVLGGIAPDALSGQPADFVEALAAHEVELRRFVTERGVQTNETQRSVGLVPAFLTVARDAGIPLELIELGPSAGLNLVLDRYRYVFAHGVWGDPAARLSFEVSERGAVPAGLLTTPLEIRRRRGIDLSPIDATTEDGARLLRAFLWPGLDERLTRLDGAIETLRQAPQKPELIAGDYVELLPALLAERPADAVTVVFQTASTGYLPPAERAGLRQALEKAGGDGRPLAWVTTRDTEEMEHERRGGWELGLRVWPEPERLAAWLDHHGNWLDWIG